LEIEIDNINEVDIALKRFKEDDLIICIDDERE
jgi:hypothetical protein